MRVDYDLGTSADEALENFTSFHEALHEAKAAHVRQRRRASDDACARPEKLTHREIEVLSWLATGKTNRDIADILGMSPRTVNKHLEHIYVKLGVETRTAAAAVAREHYGALVGA